VVQGFPSGAPEELAATLGWRYGETIPASIKAALILNIRDGGLGRFDIILGGKPVTATFPFSTLLGLESRNAGANTDTISCTIDPGDMTFVSNTTVTAWGPINKMFRGTLSHAGVNHDWTVGPGVYTRYIKILKSATLRGRAPNIGAPRQ